MRKIKPEFIVEISFTDEYVLSDENIEHLTDLALARTADMSRDREGCKASIIGELRRNGYLNDEKENKTT